MLFAESIGGVQRLTALDADTLDLLGELAPGQYQYRKELTLSETPTERAIMIFSVQMGPSYFGPCQEPRIDIFDGASLALVNRLSVPCPKVIVLPRQ